MGDNNDSVKSRTFDAIVIGSGISGGWAAKELTEKGLKTLVLERGRDVVHLKDYPTTNMNPWEFEHRGEVPREIQEANPVGLLGKYVAFHNYRAHISAIYDGFKDSTSEGRRPTSAYIPRFRNVFKQETDFLRGYAAGFSAGRSAQQKKDGIGKKLKDNLASNELGAWHVGSHMMGETIPKETNFVSLDKTRKDEWGVPLLNISVDYDDNDEKNG